MFQADCNDTFVRFSRLDTLEPVERISHFSSHKMEDFKRHGVHFAPRSLKDYYNGKSIFITGATGFLGKVLLEKLLRSCSGVEKIYILLRSKRGLASQERFDQLLEHKVFEKIREKSPEKLKKLAFVTGDVTELKLGLDESDARMLQQEIDIVFHVAANVRHNEALKDALNLNTFGTYRVMELCTEMPKLKVNQKFHESGSKSSETIFRASCTSALRTSIRTYTTSPRLFMEQFQRKIVKCLSMKLERRQTTTSAQSPSD